MKKTKSKKQKRSIAKHLVRRGQRQDGTFPQSDDDEQIERDADMEMFGDEPERFGLENIGNK